MSTSAIPVVRLVNTIQKPRQHRCLPAYEVFDWPCSKFIERARQIWPDITTCVLRLVTASGSTFNVPLEEQIIHLHTAIAIVPQSSSAAADFENSAYLELIPSIPENDPGRPKLSLYLPVCGPDDEYLFQANVKVYAASTTNRFVENIMNTLIDIHRKCDGRARGDLTFHEQFALFANDGQLVNRHLTTTDLLAGLLNGEIFVKWKLDKAERAQVTYRTHPIQEFFETEPEIISSFEYFETGEPMAVFLNSLVRSLQSDVVALIRVGQNLRKIHVQLLDELNKHPNDFFFPLGEIMLQFHDVLVPEYVQYAGFYRPIEKDLYALKNSRDSTYMKAAKLFLEKTGTDVSDILMRPIQRLPRYRMLLQAVYKYTSVHHPDYQFVKKCLTRFELAQKKADRQADKENLQLRQILAKLDQPRQLPPDTVLIDQFTLQSEKKKWRFVFLSIGIWILGVEGDRLTFHAGHEYFDLSIVEYGRGVACWEVANKADTIRVYVLASEEVRDELTARYRVQYRLLSWHRNPALPVQWAVLSSSSMRHLEMVDARVHHSMVVIPGTTSLIMFGGLTRTGELTNTTYRLEEVNGAWAFEALAQSELAPSPRYHAAMVATPNGFFLYGGTTNGSDALADLWRLSDEVWEQISPSGELPPPGFALNLAYFPDGTLLLTGAASGETFLFYRYSIESAAWTRIVSPYRFPPYIGHQVFPIGAGTGLIVNGHTPAGACNDAVIQFTEWGAAEPTFLECRGVAPVGRIWGTSGMIGSYLLVIGGERESELYILDLREQVWHFTRNTGIEQPVFFGAGAAVVGNSIYIHGGYDDTSSVQPTLHGGVLPECSEGATFATTFVGDEWRKAMVAQDLAEEEQWTEGQETV
jgi:hypothetical protein